MMFINAELRPDLIDLRSFLPLHVTDSPYQQLDQMAGVAFNALSSFGPVALPVSNSTADEFESVHLEDCSQPSYMQNFASRSFVASHDEAQDGGYVESAPPRYTYPEENYFFSQTLKFAPEEVENCPSFDSLMLSDDDDDYDEWALGGATADPAMHSETQLMDSNFHSQNGRKSPRCSKFAPISTSIAGRSPFSTHITSPEANMFENMAAHPFLVFQDPSGFGAVQHTPNVLSHEPLSAHDAAYVNRWDEGSLNLDLVNSTEPAWSLCYESSSDQPGGILLARSVPSSPTLQEAALYTKISPGTFHTAMPDTLPLLYRSPSVCELDSNEILISSDHSSIFCTDDPIIDSPPSGPEPRWRTHSAPASSPTIHVAPVLEYGVGLDEAEPQSRPSSPAQNSTSAEGAQVEVMNPQIGHAISIGRPLARKALKLKLVRRATSEHLSADSPGANAISENMEVSMLESNPVRITKFGIAILQPENRDEFLLKSRLAGLTYKEIRRLGGFTEAESTLRGRHRSLIKEKHERVRRPKWENKDVRLLREAVRKLTGSSNVSNIKVSWRSVADYIYEHGGSYRFASATCSRRWSELKMPFNPAIRARKKVRSAAISSTR